MSDITEQPAFSEWVIIELLGHRRLAGHLSEQQIAGHGFLRLDVPGSSEDMWSASQWYSPSSVYCITPVSEEVARKVAADNKPQPATRWELERGERVPGRDVEVDVVDDDDDPYEYDR